MTNMLTLLKYILALIFFTLFLSGCSTLSKDECKTADWKTIGYTDGIRGYKAIRIDKHRSACAEYNIKPNLGAYIKGRADGLQEYCTPNTAYKKGLSGYKYNGVCLGHNETKFLVAFNHGLNIYHAKSELKKLEAKYAEEELYILNLENKLYDKEDKLVSGKLPKARAIKLLHRTKEITKELEKAKSHLLHISDDINHQIQHINYLEKKPH